ncbi:MAG: DUF3108 domain-containing protein [Rhizobiales bacterium]|nr:DUF3108 domain-containing protein [Hyphomicrobiales bacterium]
MNWMNATTTRGFGLALGLAVGALAYPMALAASADESLDFTYDVVVSGLQAAEIKFNMDLTPTGYQSKASVETQGIVSFFSDSQTFVGASGEIVNGKAVPAAFSTRTEKSGKQKDFKVRWGESGQPEPHDPPVKNPQMQAEIIEALTSGVIDPLTAVLRVRGEAPCQGKERIYSGRDVFDLSFKLEREVTFGDKADGVYRGPAYQCQMVYHPIAGRDATKARKNKIEPWAVTVWFAPVDSQSLGSQMLLPVAAAGKLDGRKFRAFASRASVSGQALNQLSSISTN